MPLTLTEAVSKKLSVLLEPKVVSTTLETTGVDAGVVTAPAVVEVWPRWVSLAGGVSVTV